LKKILRNMARRFKVQTGLPSKGRKHQRRRHSRIKMDTGRFHFVQKGGQQLRIENISCSGVALNLKDFTESPKEGSLFEGILRVGKTSFEIECFVIHVTNPIVGCEFTDTTSELESVLKAAFEVELKTYSVIFKRETILEPRDRGMPFYFHNGEKDELFFEVERGHIKRFILIFEGVYFEGGEGLALKTGQVAYDQEGEVNESLSPEEIIISTPVYDSELLSLAKIFLDNLSGLNESYKEAIKDLLKTNPS